MCQWTEPAYITLSLRPHDKKLCEGNISMEESNQTINDEPEQAPRWMRYLPKLSVFANAQPQNIEAGNNHVEIVPVNCGVQTRSSTRKVVIRKSSNAFGPTSHHALTVEARLKAEKRKRSHENSGEEAMEEEEQTPVRRRVRCKNVNMLEAAELFSIVKLK